MMWEEVRFSVIRVSSVQVLKLKQALETKLPKALFVLIPDDFRHSDRSCKIQALRSKLLKRNFDQFLKLIGNILLINGDAHEEIDSE
jgi:hypothetical protein